jgi:hypothetical protein
MSDEEIISTYKEIIKAQSQTIESLNRVVETLTKQLALQTEPRITFTSQTDTINE